MKLVDFLKRTSVFVFALCLGAATCFASTKTAQDEGAITMSNTQNRIAVIETNLGTMELELFEDKTPITTKNFIDLAENGFYDGVIFHRVIDGFMIQGGDPTGTGMGGPDYTIEDEFLPELQFTGEGILAMANTGMPHTGGSQFFITLAATPWLNGHHTIFGKLLKGADVLHKIGSTKTGFQDRPVDDVVMEHVTIKSAE
ncbi:peptidylprolyl isomerase [uncultured Selenomonas sp.]|uniref:peptidylprolyl isomerase n=1 Tax=uncultured Selenomonas sp. TaxID=159275 RepID=UPI0025DEBDB7|nr:peptidylprolyl isomerase [uncultured Selenomonas sp.]